MPSTYTVNLGIEKPATGEQSGTWGDTTNTNFDILDQAINGAVRVTLTSAGTSGSPNQLQITNGAASDGRNKWIEIYSASDLGGSAYLQLDPNDAEKILFIRNSLAGSQSILLFQGTYDAARDLEVPAGVDMVVKFDGGGASAATVTDVYTKLRVTELTTPTLTATTADINGGTLDNSVIGGTTAAAITGTTIVANTSLNIAGDGATVTGIKDEDDMSSNSPTKLATQQSIKAYVDSQVGTVDTWAEVLANGATSGSTNPEVTAGQALKTDTINETTAGSGVTIDSVLLKDDVVNATDIEVSSISANDGTEAATLANSTGVMTIASSVLTTTDINGGTIDGTNIGASSAGTGAFTTLTASGDLTVDTNTLYVNSTSNQVSIGTTSSDGTLHVHTGSAGTITAAAAANDLVIENSNAVGLSLLFDDTSTNSYGVIYWGNETDGNADGRIEYFGSTYVTAGDRQAMLFRSGAAERLRLQGSAVVVNEPGNDTDFRVESDSNANQLFVDAGNSLTYVGSNTTTTIPSANGFGVKAGGEKTVVLESTAGDTLLLFRDSGTTTPPYIGSFGDDLAISGYGGGTPNVGIGITAPQSAFHINENGGPQATGNMTTGLIVSNGTAGTAMQMGTNDSGGYGYIKSAYVNSSQTGRALLLYTGTTKAVSVESGETVINDDSISRDFRVESDNSTHALFVDASTDRVGVLNSNPALPLEVTANGDNIRISTASDPANYHTNISSRYDSTFPFLLQGYYNGTQVDFIKITAASGFASPVLRIGEDMDYVSLLNGTTERVTVAPTEFIVNDLSNDYDFRVESNANTHAIFLDAGNDKVALYTSDVTGQLWGNTNTKLVVNGLAYFGDNASDMGSVPIDNVSAIASSRGVTHRGSGSTPTGTLALVRDGTSAVSYGGWAAFDLSQFETSSVASRTALHLRVGYGNLDTYNYDTVPEVATFRGDLVVFNDQSKNIDFRVESNNNTQALLVDGGNDFVAFGNTVKNTVSGYADQHGVGIDVLNGDTQIASDSLPLELGRTTTAGQNGLFVQFRHESNVVGYIGNYNGVPYIGYGGGTGGGIMFNGRSIEPTALSSTRADGTNDIGSSSFRWRHAYLSGSVYLGGTTSANALDDYEEGTWTPVLTAVSGTKTWSYSSQRGVYTKVGNLVTIFFNIQLSSDGSGTDGNARITGLPFTMETDTSLVAVYAFFWKQLIETGDVALEGRISSAGNFIDLLDGSSNYPDITPINTSVLANDRRIRGTMQYRV